MKTSKFVVPFFATALVTTSALAADGGGLADRIADERAYGYNAGKTYSNTEYSANSIRYGSADSRADALDAFPNDDFVESMNRKYGAPAAGHSMNSSTSHGADGDHMSHTIRYGSSDSRADAYVK